MSSKALTDPKSPFLHREGVGERKKERKGEGLPDAQRILLCKVNPQVASGRPSRHSTRLCSESTEAEWPYE